MGETLYAITRFMKNRPPFVLKWPLFFHNLFLCIISIILTSGIVYEVLKTWYYKGLRAVYCGTGDDDWDLELLKWGIFFYLSKFYELFDTIFFGTSKETFERTSFIPSHSCCNCLLDPDQE